MKVGMLRMAMMPGIEAFHFSLMERTEYVLAFTPRFKFQTYSSRHWKCRIFIEFVIIIRKPICSSFVDRMIINRSAFPIMFRLLFLHSFYFSQSFLPPTIIFLSLSSYSYYWKMYNYQLRRFLFFLSCKFVPLNPSLPPSLLFIIPFLALASNSWRSFCFSSFFFCLVLLHQNSSRDKTPGNKALCEHRPVFQMNWNSRLHSSDN